MSFTNTSEKLIKKFINEFDNYCLKKSARVQRSSDKILRTIYNDIKPKLKFNHK